MNSALPDPAGPWHNKRSASRVRGKFAGRKKTKRSQTKCTPAACVKKKHALSSKDDADVLEEELALELLAVDIRLLRQLHHVLEVRYIVDEQMAEVHYRF